MTNPTPDAAPFKPGEPVENERDEIWLSGPWSKSGLPRAAHPTNGLDPSPRSKFIRSTPTREAADDLREALKGLKPLIEAANTFVENGAENSTGLGNAAYRMSQIEGGFALDAALAVLAKADPKS